MNKITLLGRFVRDPEVRYTATDKIVCQGIIAVDRPFVKDDQQAADFIPIVIWGKQAEVCGNNFSKGQRILVEGRLQMRSYDAKDGSKRYVSEVIVSHFYFIEKKPANISNSGSCMEALGTAVPNEELPF